MEIFITYIIPIILGVTIGLVLMALKDYYTAKITGLDSEAFQQGMRKAQLIDVRPKKVAEQGKIKGARNISVAGLTHKSQTKVRKDLPVYLYHSSKSKVKRAARRVSLAGYQEVYYLNVPYINE